MTMRKLAVLAATLAATAGSAAAQTTPSPTPGPPPSPPPYGAPIGLERAENVIAAAVAEATRRGWTMGVAVVDSGANLVAFARMDGTQLAAAAVAEHKARAAAAFRRPTRGFEDAARNSAAPLSLDGAIASAGGVPLVADGKLIGAVGCSGGASAEDETICLAGAAVINGAGN
jgi:glc operon protein GlcG